jgi:hypothetical protein
MSRKRRIDEIWNSKQYGIKVLQSGEGNFALIERDGMRISVENSGTKIEYNEGRSSIGDCKEMPLSTGVVKITQTGNSNLVSIRSSAQPYNEKLSQKSDN